MEILTDGRYTIELPDGTIEKEAFRLDYYYNGCLIATRYNDGSVYVTDPDFWVIEESFFYKGEEYHGSKTRFYDYGFKRNKDKRHNNYTSIGKKPLY